MRDGPIWLAALVVLSLCGSLFYLHHKGHKPTRRSFYIRILIRPDNSALIHCGECDEYLFGRTLMPLDQARQEAHIHLWEHVIGAKA